MGILHESDTSSEPMELFDAPPSEPVAISGFSSMEQHEWEPNVEASAAVTAQASPIATVESTAPAASEPTAPVKIKSQTATSVAPQAPPEMLSFDLGTLSLDLDATPKPEPVVPEEPDTDGMDPLATKLALAREFQSIGDNDGAHALAEEVFTLASGQLRADAKLFLSELGFAQSGFDHSTF
jgi:pilus assembly protein FimV